MLQSQQTSFTTDNQKINSLKGNEQDNQDTHTDATREEDASVEDDSRPDEITQKSIDDSPLENHRNDHHTGEKGDDGTHPATEGTNVDTENEIEEHTLKSYDDDSYYETHELDEHQETHEYTEEFGEGKGV